MRNYPTTRKEYPTLKAIMSKAELERYVKFHDDMCSDIVTYGKYEIVVEYMAGPKGDYFWVVIYEYRKPRGNEYYRKVMEFEFSPSYNEETERYNEDEIFEKAVKMISAYNA